MMISLALGLAKLGSTGPLWPDAPRYANGGAMVHDWLASGAPANVYRFATGNYARYPAFSIPYHPPAYPIALGGLFLVTDVSYVAARCFVALCLGASACLISTILRRLGSGPAAAFGCALLWATTPEAVRWARDTMSEVPSLAAMLAATAVFLSWLDSATPRPWRAWLAFSLASLAFFCRVTTAGILPCWFLFAAATGRARRVTSPHVALALALYLGTGVGYVRFAAAFSKHEVAADGKGQGPTFQNLASYAACLSEAATWGTTAMAAAGLFVAVGAGRRSRVARFGLCWLSSFCAFKLATPTSPEIRHAFGGLPALPILAACLWDPSLSPILRRNLAPALLALALGANLYHDAGLPRGVVGYEEFAQLLARETRGGNVLLACPEDQELIFRYRAAAPRAGRVMVRADRTLAIRVSAYAKAAARIVARGPDDLVRVICDGRIRYLATAGPDLTGPDRRTEEMVLAHSTASDRPRAFRRIGEVPLLIQYNRPGRRLSVVLWEYLGDLPEGPSTLSVVIPTAGISVKGGR